MTTTNAAANKTPDDSFQTLLILTVLKDDLSEDIRRFTEDSRELRWGDKTAMADIGVVEQASETAKAVLGCLQTHSNTMMRIEREVIVEGAHALAKRMLVEQANLIRSILREVPRLRHINQ